MADNILKNKVIVKQSCLAFGAFETAKKISHDKEKIHILISQLIEEFLTPTAYLIAKNFLAEEERTEYNENFQDLENPEEITRNKLSGELHLKLTGESILETKKKLRALKKEKIAKEKEEAKKNKEIPTHNKEGVEYLTLEEFNFVRENFFFVPTTRSFALVKDRFLAAKIIGFDTEFVGGDLSTITLAIEDFVAVFDMVALKKATEVSDFMKTILTSTEIEIVAHTFRTDAYVINESLGIDPYSIEKVLDLTEIVKEGETENRLGLQKMVQLYFEKALNQYYKRQDWGARPIEEEMISYAALNGFIVLKIFMMYESKPENTVKGMKYYDYDPPKGNPIRGRAPAKTKKNARAGKKTTNNNRRKKNNNNNRGKSNRGKSSRGNRNNNGGNGRSNRNNNGGNGRSRNNNGGRNNQKSRNNNNRRNNRRNDDYDDRDDRDDRDYQRGGNGGRNNRRGGNNGGRGKRRGQRGGRSNRGGYRR